MAWRGSTSVSANDFVLATRALPAGVNALFLSGQGQAQTPLADGFLCIASTLQRLGTAATNALGVAVFPVDWATVVGATPGQVLEFQAYYRDPAAGGANANLTDGLEAIVCP